LYILVVQNSRSAPPFFQKGGIVLDSPFSVHVEGLRVGEVMQSMRRMMYRPYFLAWLVVYGVVLVVALVRRSIGPFGLLGPGIILILLALSYEFSGRKSFRPMGYDKAVLDYEFSPQGYRLTVGEQSVFVQWKDATLRKTRSNFLLYSDPKNSSVLPKRCLTAEQQNQLCQWSQQKSFSKGKDTQ
jgi:hypothetical protein